MNTWNNLSLSEKSEMMRVAIENGITTLPEIREAYNQFAEGGDIPPITPFSQKEEVIITPDSEYNAYLNTLPDNQRFTPNDKYDSYLYWKLNGRPRNFEQAYSEGMFTYDNSDNAYHANSIAWGDDGIGYFMKPKTHDTVKYELDWFNKGLVIEEGGKQRPETAEERKNSDIFRHDYELIDDPSRPNFYRYQPVQHSHGGNLFSGEEDHSSQMHQGYVYDVLPKMLKEAGLNVRVTSGYRRPGQAGKAGSRSWHTHHGAVDIVPQGKTTFEDIENALYNNPVISRYMIDNGFGLIDESGRTAESKATMKKTGATGAHFHIGKDSKAVSAYNNKMSSIWDSNMSQLETAINQPALPVFMPSNPQAFFTPLESYQRPVEVEEPLVQAAMENPYSPEQLEREERRRGLNNLSFLLGMTSPQGSDNSFASTIGMLANSQFANGGNLFDGTTQPTQQMNNGLNLYRRTNNLGETEYIYQETPDSEEILLTPTNKRFSDDPTNWDYTDASGRKYSPRMATAYNPGEIREDTRGPLERMVDNYFGELKYQVNNNVPISGKYTMPAIAAAPFLAWAGEAAYPYVSAALANPYVDAGLTSAFAGHGLNHAINEGINSWGDAAMTALEIAPLGRLARPMSKEVARAVENYRYPFGRPQVPEGYITVNPQIRTRVGDVEIDNPELYYHQADAGKAENFVSTGRMRTPLEEYWLAKEEAGEHIPTKLRAGIEPGYPQDPGSAMFAQGNLWYGLTPNKPDLLVTAREMPIANKNASIMSDKASLRALEAQGTRRVTNDNIYTQGPHNRQNTAAYTWEPGYGYRRVFAEETPIADWPVSRTASQITAENAASMTPKVNWDADNWFKTISGRGSYSAEEAAELASHVPEYRAIEQRLFDEGKLAADSNGNIIVVGSEMSPQEYIMRQSEAFQKMNPEHHYVGVSKKLRDTFENEARDPATRNRYDVWTDRKSSKNVEEYAISQQGGYTNASQIEKIENQMSIREENYELHKEQLKWKLKHGKISQETYDRDLAALEDNYNIKQKEDGEELKVLRQQEALDPLNGGKVFDVTYPRNAAEAPVVDAEGNHWHSIPYLTVQRDAPVLTSHYQPYDPVNTTVQTDQLVTASRRHGYGVTHIDNVKDTYDGTMLNETIIGRGTPVKSVLGNTGTFDIESPNKWKLYRSLLPPFLGLGAVGALYGKQE